MIMTEKCSDETKPLIFPTVDGGKTHTITFEYNENCHCCNVPWFGTWLHCAKCVDKFHKEAL